MRLHFATTLHLRLAPTSMSPEPIRVSLLGLGRAGNFHMQSLALVNSAKLVRVFDTDPAKAEHCASQHQCSVARNVEEAITADDVDAVIVATPTNAHFELSKMALDAGKPLLTEKPLGSSIHQIDECFHSATRANVPLLVAFQRRFDPSFASLIQATHRGDVGQPHFIRSVSRDNPVPSVDYLKISGGIFHDCMVHDLDMVVLLARSRPTHISAFASSFIPEIQQMNDHDNVVGIIKFENGITASIDINRQSAYGYDQRLEVFGDQGMLQADNQYQSTIRHATQQGIARPPIEYSFPTRYREAYRAELNCFLQAIRGETEIPITHQDVRINHLLAIGMETAARESRTIPFEQLDALATDHETH